MINECFNTNGNFYHRYLICLFQDDNMSYAFKESLTDSFKASRWVRPAYFSGQLASFGDLQGYMLANIFELILFGALSLPISKLNLICL